MLENELSSVITQTLPLESARWERLFEWSHLQDFGSFLLLIKFAFGSEGINHAIVVFESRPPELYKDDACYEFPGK